MKDGELVKEMNEPSHDQENVHVNKLSLERINQFKHNYWLDHQQQNKQQNPKQACVTIDMSSPNIGKLMSLNHIRSTIVGNALQKIYQYAGYKTVTINHKGDTGDYLTPLVFAIQTWGKEIMDEKCPLRSFTRLLQKFHEDVDLNPELDDQLYYVKRQLNQKDSKASQILSEIYKQSNASFDIIYDRFNVAFDLSRYESSYLNHAEEWITVMVEKGYAEIDENSVTLPLDQYELPLGLLKNGQPLYLARDIVSARDTAEKYQSDFNLYVVGNEQTTHFNQVVASLDQYTDMNADEFIHDALGYTAVLGKRHFNLKHEVKDIRDVLTKLEEAIASKRDQITFIKANDQVEQIATNSLIFTLLNHKRLEGIDLDFDHMVDLEGETFLHLLEAYRKLKQSLADNDDQVGETEVGQTQLSHAFKESIYQAYMLDEPCYIAQYLNGLCAIANNVVSIGKEDLVLALDEFELGFHLLGLEISR